MFQSLFDFFDSYNFTIDENDPNDAEVGVDPEMLGKIFENLWRITRTREPSIPQRKSFVTCVRSR